MVLIQSVSRRSSVCRQSEAKRVGIEILEQRSLLAGVALGPDGTLTVTGSANTDVISVASNVNINGTIYSIPAAASKIIVNAGGGNDKVTVSSFGPVVINGEGGNDELTNTGGDPLSDSPNNFTTINGGDGDDKLFDFDYAATDGVLHGDGGNDTLQTNGNYGYPKELFGDDGNDVIITHLDVSDNVSGGAGTDEVRYVQGFSVNVSLDGIANDGEQLEGVDNIKTDVENISVSAAGGTVKIAGSALANVITVTGAAQSIDIDGKGGNDTINCASSSSSAATLHGGTGDDVLFGTSAGGMLFGDDGNDRIVPGAGPDYISGGGWGSDLVDYSARTKPLILSIGSGAVSGEAGEKDNILTDVENVSGGSGNDTIVGSKFNNVLLGNNGDDVIRGGDGNDLIVAGAGKDKVFGDAGDDTIYVADGTFDDIVDAGLGFDKVRRDQSGASSDRVYSSELFF